MVVQKMPELKITDDNERQLILSALISHVYKCKDTINLHNQTKNALGDKAMVLTAEKATAEMHDALTMIAKYYGVHLGGSKFYCLNCAPAKGEEHDRMTQAEFAWWNECTSCGNGAYYFVEPKI
jgi:hypothetical protein